MQKRMWLVGLMALVASGLIAAGCGDDDETTTAAETTTEATETTGETTTEETTTEDSEGTSATPDDVYNACIDAIEGTPAEAAGETACEQARNAFEQCTAQAESVPEGNAGRDLAIQACQDAAEQATAALEASG